MGLIFDLNKDTYNERFSVVKVDNNNYMTFKSFNVKRSIDDVCGTFSIELSRPPSGKNPFKSQDVIDIVLDGVQVMRGKIYETQLDGTAIEDNITIAGRDITGDIIDSTVPEGAKVFSDGVGMFDIASKIITSLGLGETIPILNLTGEKIEPFSKDELVTVDAGTTVAEILMKYATKRQLFINTGPTGQLVFFKANGSDSGNVLVNKFKSNENNVIGYKTKFNTSERFYRYICYSQDSNGWDALDMNTAGVAFDTQIATHRQLEFMMEEGGKQSEVKLRAEEEANIRKARAFEYEALVQGFKQKTPWQTNKFIEIQDEKSGISGQHLVKSVEYSLTNDRGRTTKLVCTHRDAYTLQAAIDKRSKTGTGWVNDSSPAPSPTFDDPNS